MTSEKASVGFLLRIVVECKQDKEESYCWSGRRWSLMLMMSILYRHWAVFDEADDFSIMTCGDFTECQSARLQWWECLWWWCMRVWLIPVDLGHNRNEYLCRSVFPEELLSSPKSILLLLHKCPIPYGSIYARSNVRVETVLISRRNAKQDYACLMQWKKDSSENRLFWN